MCPHVPYVVHSTYMVHQSYVSLCDLCGSNLSHNLPHQANKALTTSSIFPH